MTEITFSGTRGAQWCRQGAGYWHRPGATCAPPKPDHFYTCAAELGPDVTPAINPEKVCEECR